MPARAILFGLIVFWLTPPCGGSGFNNGGWPTNDGAGRSAAAAVVDQNYEPECLFDAEVSYCLNKAVLGFGIQNLFDAFPDENLPENASLGTLPYPSHSPFGMNGRFLYGRISYTFEPRIVLNFLEPTRSCRVARS